MYWPNHVWFIFPYKHRFPSLGLDIWHNPNGLWKQRKLEEMVSEIFDHFLTTELGSMIFPKTPIVRKESLLRMIYLTSQTLCFVTRMQQITLLIYLWCTSSTTFTFIPEYSSSWFTLWKIFLSSNWNGFWEIARWTCGWTSGTTFWFVSRFLNDISKFWTDIPRSEIFF